MLARSNPGYGIQFESGADNNLAVACRVADNTTGGILDSGTGNTIRDNPGFASENSGTATLVNGQTTIAVTHGLDVTPAAGDVMLTPIEAWGSMTEFRVSTYTSTQFTITADQDPGQDVDFAWKAIVL